MTQFLSIANVVLLLYLFQLAVEEVWAGRSSFKSLVRKVDVINRDCHECKDQLTQTALNNVTTESLTTISFRHTRELQNHQYYHVVKKFGNGKLYNYDVTLGNPHRGLASAPYIRDGNQTGILYSLESFYYPLNGFVIGYQKYNWTDFEVKFLQPIASRSFHAIPRVFIHYPGQPIALPKYLEGRVKMIYYPMMGGGFSPDYTNVELQDCIRDFIAAFGERYDGDSRISTIQAGLLGFWGEWHTFSRPPIQGIDIPESLKSNVISWYDNAFNITPIMVRYPRKDANLVRSFGLHDDSFTYYTLDGAPAGGVVRDFYFVPSLIREGVQDFWKRGPMGGEVRPENVLAVFDDNWGAPAEYKQHFFSCSQKTHSTYNKVGGIFSDKQRRAQENIIKRANWNSARMGYAFQVLSASFVVSTKVMNSVDVHVVVENIGIAPIYYPTFLALSCKGAKHTVKGVEQLIEQYSTKTFYYIGIPASPECLSNLTLSLESKYVYPTRPIKFAQNNNGYVSFSSPLPSNTGIVRLKRGRTTQQSTQSLSSITSTKGKT